MHMSGLVHLDVKPGNATWLDSLGILKIIDLGMASQFPVSRNEQLPYANYVTDYYRPPELWKASPEMMPKLLRPSVDYWSWGCCLYEIATGGFLMSPVCADSNGVLAMVKTWSSTFYYSHVHVRPPSRPSSVQCPRSTVSKESMRLGCRLARLNTETRRALLLACHPEFGSRTMLDVATQLWKSAMQL